MGDFTGYNLNALTVKWYQWFYLWAFKTVALKDDNAVHYFKKAFGQWFYMGKKQLLNRKDRRLLARLRRHS